LLRAIVPVASQQTRPPPRSPRSPYTTLFRSGGDGRRRGVQAAVRRLRPGHPRLEPSRRIRTGAVSGTRRRQSPHPRRRAAAGARSEEHTSELQSRENLVCRLLLEKKKKHKIT